MAGVALVIAARERAAPISEALAAAHIAAVFVPDPVAAMLVVGRAPFGVVVVVAAHKSSAPILLDLLRIARHRHETIEIITVGHDTIAGAPKLQRFAADMTAAQLASAVAVALSRVGSVLEGIDDVTMHDHRPPVLLDGSFGEGAGAALLTSAWGQELTGILTVDGGAAAGDLFFVAGDPVGATLASGVDVDVRERVIAVVEQREGSYVFHADARFVEQRALTRVNPFGLMLEARRRRLGPAGVMAAHDALARRYLYPGAGLVRAAERLKPFARGYDLAALVTGTATVASILDKAGLDPMMGALVVLTLEEAHLATLADTPLTVAPVSAPIGELSMPPVTKHDIRLTTDDVEFDVATIRARIAVSVGGGEPSATEPDGKADTYELTKRIGAGGMAEVFEGRRLGAHGFAKRVAVKRILPEMAANPEFVEMFLEEARVAARLSHPNIVEVMDLGSSGKDFYIVMEYVAGTDLLSIHDAGQRASRAMPVEVAARIVADLCAGLDAAHSHIGDDGKPSPIIHRDVSLGNILVSEHGQVKLADFGIAKRSDSPVHTRTGVWKGKYSYLAPEILRGAKADARTDIFAAGVVLFTCIAGVNPFSKTAGPDALTTLLRGTAPRLEDFRKVPPALAAISARAIAFNPDERYQTARDLRQALDEFAMKGGAAPALAAEVAAWARLVMREQPKKSESVLDPTGLVLAPLPVSARATK